jgi:hypothetical protein
MSPKAEALQRRWEAGIEPAKPEDSSWSPAPEVTPIVVDFNRNGDVVAVRFLRFRLTKSNSARESRPRRRRAATASAASRRGPPSDDPPLDPPSARPPLSRAERVYLKAEVDRLRREQLAAQRALDRALFAWGSAEVVG